MPLSCTPWRGGSRPLRIVACEGRVRGTDATASVEQAPPAASASRCGVRPAGRAVGAHAVGAQRVDGDQQHAGRRRWRWRGAGTPRRARRGRRRPGRGARSSQRREARLGARSRVTGSASAASYSRRGGGAIAAHARDLPEVVVGLPVRGLDLEPGVERLRAPRPCGPPARARWRGRRRGRRCAARPRSPSRNTGSTRGPPRAQQRVGQPEVHERVRRGRGPRSRDRRRWPPRGRRTGPPRARSETRPPPCPWGRRRCRPPPGPWT